MSKRKLRIVKPPKPAKRCRKPCKPRHQEDLADIRVLRVQPPHGGVGKTVVEVMGLVPDDE